MPEGAIANRRAALLAHAMPAADREWLLSELDASHRSVLAGLLEELRAMGIPKDPALVRQLLDEEAAGDPQRSLAALAAADVPKLVDVLRGEPDAVVATFLRAQAWPWRDSVLGKLGASAEQAFARLSSPGACRLEEAIVAAVWAAVAAGGTSRPNLPRGHRWAKLLRRGVRA